jgi:ATP-binding cassette subfamily C (CFTR/MRP) protein 1
MDNGEISAKGSLSVSENEAGISLDYLGRSGGTSISTVPLISFENQDFGWKKAGTPTLQAINATISANRFMVVLGATGSGKSTFLQSIIGEAIALGGKTERNFGYAAYCSQVPWLINGTIKQNIVGGSRGPVDESWYRTVVRACGLQGDLEKMPNGDRTLVGDDGGTLSGGQRQRVVSVIECRPLY